MEAAILLILLLSGVIAGSVCGIAILIIGYIVVATLFIIGTYYSKQLLHLVLSEHLLKSGSLLLVFLIGLSDSYFRQVEEFQPVNSGNYKFEAQVENRRTLSTSERYNLEIIKVNGEARRGKLILFASPSFIFERGDVISFISQVQDNTTVNEKASLPLRVQLYSNDKLINVKEAGIVRKWLNNQASKIKTLIENSTLSTNCKSILCALTIGDRTSISSEKMSLFRNAGVIHVMALSGMHIGIIAAVILWITLPMNLVSKGRWRFVVVILSIWFFVALTGGAYSTIRAGIMITITMLAMILDRHRDAFSICCYSAFFMILMWPDVIYDIGFQLSFFSVLMLTLLAEPLNPFSHRQNPGLYKFFALVISTVVATMATWFIAAYHFGSASLSFLPANIFILPLLPGYLIGGVIFIALESMGVVIAPLRWFLDKGLDLTYDILVFTGSPQVELQIGIWTLSIWIASLLSLGIALRKLRIRYAEKGTLAVKQQSVDFIWLGVSMFFMLVTFILLPHNI